MKRCKIWKTTKEKGGQAYSKDKEEKWEERGEEGEEGWKRGGK